MGFAAHVADRIAFIDEGRIIDEGPPRRVFHESPEPRVRQFLQTYHDRNSFLREALPQHGSALAGRWPVLQLCAALSLSIGKPRWCQTG